MNAGPKRQPSLASPEDLTAQVIERTVQVASVPAPTGHEQRRAELVAEWWRADGFAGVSIDEVGNCWAVAREGTGAAVVLAAHLDTVFDGDTDHSVTRSADRLFGPGVGDDGVAIAALGAVGKLLGSSSGSRPVYILATVGEEGLGNLVGARHAVAHAPVDLAGFIAVEGNYLGRIATTGVGSCRWRALVTGPGGHAWEQSRAPSALHEAARLVGGLSSIPTTQGMTSLNVGRLDGGESINAIARRATFDLDLRGADEISLAHLEATARSVLEAPIAGGLEIELTEIGRRPAGRIEADHPLLNAAKDALSVRSIPWKEIAASTDANAACAAGIPALALGVTTGSQEHTPDEWIDLGPIGQGIAILADTVARFDKASTPSSVHDRG